LYRFQDIQSINQQSINLIEYGSSITRQYKNINIHLHTINAETVIDSLQMRKEETIF